jgi:hypothetical protein
MNEDFLKNLNTEKGKDYYQSKEYIIDYVDYMIDIISNTNHKLKEMYIDVLNSVKNLEHDIIVKKIRPIEVIFNDYDLATYGVYKRAKVINRELMVKYIDYLIKIINDKNNILDEPILVALNLYRKYKHYETIKEKLKPIENYLNTNLDEYLKPKKFKQNTN